MIHPFTFGVELECRVAYISHSTKIAVEYGPKEGTVLFPETKASSSSYYQKEYESIKATMFRLITQHMAQTIAATGKFSINPSDLSCSDITMWELDTDESVQDGDINDEEEVKNEEGLQYAAIEIKSPALVYSRESLEEVKAMCELLHSHGQEGFTDESLRRILTFLYTFEPQISSVHPPYRINTWYASSLRSSSKFAVRLLQETERRATPFDFFEAVYSCASRADILKISGNKCDKANGYCNCSSLVRFGNLPLRRQTIEMRQHKGTITGIQVCNWVDTLVTMFDFAENGDPESFFNLLQTTWQREWFDELEDLPEKDELKALDDENERRLGPVLADGGFRIWDLMNWLGRQDLADYWEKSDNWNHSEQ